MIKFLLQVLFIVVPLPLAQATFEVPHVKVFGVAEKEVVPDELKWAVSVRTQGMSVETVSSDHSKEVAAVLKFLLGSGLTLENVKTSRMQLQENWVYRANSRVREGYYGFTAIQFTTTDFSEYLNYWRKLSTFKNMTIGEVRFDISNRAEIQNLVRIDAVKNGRMKATALAEALNAKIVEVLQIEESNDYSRRPANAMRTMEMAGTGGEASISSGKEIVRARVLTVFRIAAE